MRALSKELEQYYCPACKYELGFKPWNGSSASDEICPCCGIQFGYDDCEGGDEMKRLEFYKRARDRWIKDGCKWYSSNPPPAGWNPKEQLNR